jgi:3-oxoacyl-[acyl-carrier protein] reductase
MSGLFQTMIIDLKHKTALVCGSTQGIGNAIAMQIAACGATVCLIARNEDELKKTVAELPVPMQQKHFYAVADFNDSNNLKRALEAIHAKSSIDILVNNTGGPPSGLAIDAPPEQFLQAFQQHLICNQILVQAFVPGMKERKWGRIINVISTSVKIPLKNLGVSNTIRGAVANWSKTLANELGQYGITVNNILPGATNTGRLQAIIKNNASKKGISEEEAKKEMLHEIPVGRFAEPQEPAYVAAFLSSDYAAYINGINIPIDGGRTGSL